MEQILIALREMEERMNAKFNKMDERFEKMDERFESIDQRFEKLDERFQTTDRRQEKSENRHQKIDSKLKHLDEQIGSLNFKFNRMESTLNTIAQNGQDDTITILNRIDSITNSTKEDIDFLAEQVGRHEMYFKRLNKS